MSVQLRAARVWQSAFTLLVASSMFIGLSARGISQVAATVSPPGAENRSSSGVHFDLAKMSTPPVEYLTDRCNAEGVRALFYEGAAYKGKQTRVFAYYGVPQATGQRQEKAWPAMALLHGGGGTAFDRWVRLWNERGYAAIAMDLCGCLPEGSYGKWSRHEHAGPLGWNASFDQLDDAIEDQWTWHAVTAVALAHSLIRSYEEVDPNRIGVTGISWGGYLTSIVAGVDARFKLAVPVYGCGFLGDNSAWLSQFQAMDPSKAKLWLDQWDPSAYLPSAKMPILWVNGTNDFAYPMDSWQKSYRLAESNSQLCLRVRMPHGHGQAGENPEEIHVFANSLINGGSTFPKIIAQGTRGSTAWATFEAEIPIERAELNFTRDSGPWPDRKWESIPVALDSSNRRAEATIPEDATVYYLNLFDQRNCAVSSQHEQR